MGAGWLTRAPGIASRDKGSPPIWRRRRGTGFGVRRITYIHPEALAFFKKNRIFGFASALSSTARPGACQVLRTMNIFNTAYFSEQQLAPVFDSLEPGGIWIVGQTRDESSRPLGANSAIMYHFFAGWRKAGVSATDPRWKSWCSTATQGRPPARLNHQGTGDVAIAADVMIGRHRRPQLVV